jgi:hypothetical protein
MAAHETPHDSTASAAATDLGMDVSFGHYLRLIQRVLSSVS